MTWPPGLSSLEGAGNHWKEWGMLAPPSSLGLSWHLCFLLTWREVPDASLCCYTGRSGGGGEAAPRVKGEFGVPLPWGLHRPCSPG